MAIRNPKSEIRNSHGSSRRLVWEIVKWSLCLLVVVFVIRRALLLWRDEGIQQVHFSFESSGWLALSGGVYVAGWLPSVWFWQQLMRSLGGRVRFADSARAYYCGHLGKYVPGKVTVLVIRAALIKDRGSPAGPAALTAAYETVVMMGVGLAVGVALLPMMFTETSTHAPPVWSGRLIKLPFLAPILIVALGVLLLPLLSRLLTQIAVRMASTKVNREGRSVRIGTKLLARGMLALVAGWSLHGLSLGLTLRAVTAAPLDLGQWPVWVAAVSLATSVGFVVIFAPGGLGVREELLMEVLRIQPDVGPQQAVAAAFLLRLVWLVAEIVAAVVLYYAVQARSTPSPVQEPGR